MTNTTDVVIHINETLDCEHRDILSSEVRHFDGVISAALKGRRPHLMIVTYNPVKTKPLNVLTGVINSGMHAQLVGW